MFTLIVYFGAVTGFTGAFLGVTAGAPILDFLPLSAVGSKSLYMTVSFY